MPKGKKNQPMLFAEMQTARDEADDKAQLRFDMFEAIGEACGANLKGSTRLGCGIFWKAADSLIEVGGTPAEVHRRMEIIAAKGDKFRTVGCLLKYWGSACESQPRYTTNYGVSTKPEPEEFDQNLENIRITERSARVAELDEAERTRLTREALAKAPPRRADRMRREPDAMNVAICMLLDGGECRAWQDR